MIVRLSGEGQFVLEEDEVRQLNRLDADLETAIESGDECVFGTVLKSMHALVHDRGNRLSADSLEPSDAIVPPVDATMTEVKALLSEEGLIPG